jgi:hypothetical protein
MNRQTIHPLLATASRPHPFSGTHPVEPLLTLNKVNRRLSVSAKTIPRQHTIKIYGMSNHNMSLMRAEEKFGYGGGNKFSTYPGGSRPAVRRHEGARPTAPPRYPYHFVRFRVTDFRSCYQEKSGRCSAEWTSWSSDLVKTAFNEAERPGFTSNKGIIAGKNSQIHDWRGNCDIRVQPKKNQTDCTSFRSLYEPESRNYHTTSLA